MTCFILIYLVPSKFKWYIISGIQIVKFERCFLKLYHKFFPFSENKNFLVAKLLFNIHLIHIINDLFGRLACPSSNSRYKYMGSGALYDDVPCNEPCLNL